MGQFRQMPMMRNNKHSQATMSLDRAGGSIGPPVQHGRQPPITRQYTSATFKLTGWARQDGADMLALDAAPDLEPRLRTSRHGDPSPAPPSARRIDAAGHPPPAKKRGFRCRNSKCSLPELRNRADRFSAGHVPGRSVPRSADDDEQCSDPGEGGEAFQKIPTVLSTVGQGLPFSGPFMPGSDRSCFLATTSSIGHR